MSILKKSILMISLISILSSCTSIKVLKAERQKVLPGISIGGIYFKYTIELEISKETKFVNIKLNNKSIQKFSVLNLASNLQSDNSMLYPKGKYSLQFSEPFKEVEEISKNDIIIEYKQNENSKFLKMKAEIVEVLQLK
jgi:hypothetical protein